MIDSQTGKRLAMTATGAAAGLSFFLLGQVLEREMLGERAAMALMVLAVVFFTALLGMAGPLRLGRAAALAAGQAVAVAALLFWGSFRYGALSDFFNTPVPFLAAFVLVFVPMPFLVAAATRGWRDYPTLFNEAWTIVIRYAAAWLFVGLVWAVLFVSDLLLRMVGVPVIAHLMEQPLFGFVLSGAMLGLGIAVVDEMADVVSPYLVLRLLRLLLVPVVLVVAVFLLVLPLRGLDRLFGQLSAAATLLSIAALGATLVTAALDQSEEEATRSVPVRAAARLMAALILAPAGLGAWAVWLRVQQYGWTPDRVFAGCVAALGLGYGVLYLAAVLRGRGWEARLRRANIHMALALLALAVLIFTPLLSPEGIAARSQLARYEAGRVTAARLDLAGLEDWGRPGAAALARLATLAEAPGQEALRARLADRSQQAEVSGRDAESLRAELAALMPLRPATETALRDTILASRQDYELQDWLSACRRSLPGGQPACVMLVADFWADLPGSEVAVLTLSEDQWLAGAGFVLRDAFWEWRELRPAGEAMPRGAAAEILLQELLAAPAPQLVPLPGQMIPAQGGGLILMR